VTQLKTVDGPGELAEWGDAAGKVIGWHARDVREFEPRVRKDWKTFAATSPFWAPAA